MTVTELAVEETSLGDARLFKLDCFGYSATITNYGAIVQSLSVPYANGSIDVVLGLDCVQSYIDNNTGPYFGCVIGRCANRVSKGKFTLDNIDYSLPINDPPNSLHGGVRSFSRVIWDASIIDDSLVLEYTSCDGEEGYPGNLTARVTYFFCCDTNGTGLHVEYEARTDRPTIVNLTNHSYFNLSGHDSLSSGLDQKLFINSDYYLPATLDMIPTGVLRSVSNSNFDFRVPKPLKPNEYDHAYVSKFPGVYHNIARLSSSTTRVSMGVFTTQPSVQVYTANFLDSTILGKSGCLYSKYQGVCLETQGFPDAINQPGFPSVILRPEQTYSEHTAYVFGRTSD